MSRIVGLTGGIGAGKSTVAAMLADLGADVIDVDALGRAVIGPDGDAVGEALRRFGTDLAAADGGIDRARLAAVVFSDPQALADLEAISHPAINRQIDHLLDAMETTKLVVLDMAILLGSRLGLDLPSGRRYRQVIVVETPEAVRVERLITQRAMARSDALARIASQPTDAERRTVADYVLHNDGDLTGLRTAVGDLYAKLSSP